MYIWDETKFVKEYYTLTCLQNNFRSIRRWQLPFIRPSVWHFCSIFTMQTPQRHKMSEFASPTSGENSNTFPQELLQDPTAFWSNTAAMFFAIMQRKIKIKAVLHTTSHKKTPNSPISPEWVDSQRLVPACCHPPAQPPGKPASFPNEINNFACRIKQLPAALARVNKGWEQTTFSQSEGLKRAKGSLQPSCLRSAGRAAAGELAIC